MFLRKVHNKKQDTTQDEISIQYLRALPNRDRILNNDVFIEAVRYILALPSHILQPFADGHHFIGRNATLVDAYGIMVKNALLINARNYSKSYY